MRRWTDAARGRVMTGLEILAATTAGLGAIGVWEAMTHRRRLRRIPLRLHVSGTRGKSSVTRLLGAGLNGAGVRAVAKTTGTLARMILPDGREVPIFRPTGPNILEQIRIVAATEAVGAQALAIECMALRPELHWLSESLLVRATHGVITNARADHLDVMGPGTEDVARCLAGMIPVRGVLYTTERPHLGILAEAARQRGTKLVSVGAEEVAAVTEDELAGFGYTAHAENVALVLRILADLGVERGPALRGMRQVRPDPGAMMTHRVEFFGRRIDFVNGFAANDPQSTERVWQMALAQSGAGKRTIAVFNLRGDRPGRTEQLARGSDFWHAADHIVLMGSGTWVFARMAAKAGIDPARFTYAEHETVDGIFEAIIGLCGPRNVVVGTGNLGGQGLELARYFAHRTTLAEAP